MDEETADHILDRAEYIRDSLGILTQKQPLDRDEYLSDRATQDIVERRFETAIQACIDIASLILKAENKPVPDASADRLRALVDIDVISTSLADRMASTVGFRNVLAHQYGDRIDDTIVYDSLHDLDRFHQFLTAVREYLSERGAI